MKHIQALVLAAMCGFVSMLACSASAQSIHSGVITVVRVVGEARYSLGDGNWHPLVAGKILAPGSVLQTGHNGTVDVILGKKVLMPEADPVPDRISMAEDPNVRGYVSYKPSAEQNAIRLTADTTLAIDKLNVSDTGVDTVSDTELDLRQGRIYCSVKKLSGASQYLIKIPNGIAGVRGTLFVIDASGFVGVLRNSVVLSIIGPDGKPITVVVGEGSQFDPKTGLIAPMTSDINLALDQVIVALRTLYWGEVNFTFDREQCHISPIHRPHGGGHQTGWWSWW